MKEREGRARQLRDLILARRAYERTAYDALLYIHSKASNELFGAYPSEIV